MRTSILMTTLAFVACAASVAGGQEVNLLPNGSFDQPGQPFSGWYVDYAWTENNFYKDNASYVSFLPAYRGRQGVAKIDLNQKGADYGSKIESILLPFEDGTRYRATMKICGGPYRIYFSGYRWTPGIRPHDQPTLQEMRQVYRSVAVHEKLGHSDWKEISLEIPGIDASDLSMRHLKQVRYVTLYIWALRTTYVDDVRIVRPKP